MTFVGVAAVISAALAIYCIVPYVRAVLAGKTVPHQLSWVVFVIMNGIVFFSQLFEGGRGSVVIALVFLVGSAAVLALSLTHGTRHTSRWDRLLFACALIIVVIWVLTRSNSVAIWLTVLIDVAATSMMMLKVKAQPYSEAPYPWMVATVAYVFTCLTLVDQPPGVLYVRPVYGLISDLLFVLFIYYMRAKAHGSTVIAGPLKLLAKDQPSTPTLPPRQAD